MVDMYCTRSFPKNDLEFWIHAAVSEKPQLTGDRQSMPTPRQ